MKNMGVNLIFCTLCSMYSTICSKRWYVDGHGRSAQLWVMGLLHLRWQFQVWGLCFSPYHRVMHTQQHSQQFYKGSIVLWRNKTHSLVYYISTANRSLLSGKTTAGQYFRKGRGQLQTPAKGARTQHCYWTHTLMACLLTKWMNLKNRRRNIFTWVFSMSDLCCKTETAEATDTILFWFQVSTHPDCENNNTKKTTFFVNVLSGCGWASASDVEIQK